MQPSTVYALIDPRTHAVRYVGLTGNPVNGRLRSHCEPARATRPTELGRWLRELRDASLLPHFVVLEEVRGVREQSLAAEKRWIRAFFDAGAALTNVQTVDLLQMQRASAERIAQDRLRARTGSS